MKRTMTGGLACIAMAAFFLGQAGNCASAAEMADILGSPIAGWQIGPVYGADNSHVAQVDGRTVLQVGTSALRLSRLEAVTENTEVTAVFRFSDPEKHPWLQLQAGLQGPADQEDNPFLFHIQFPNYAPPDTVLLTLGRENGQKYSSQLWYRLRFLPANRLSWPTMVRQRVEADEAALPPLAKHWFTMRCECRANNWRVYIDDRLLQENKGDGVNAEGRFSVLVTGGVDLASVRVKRLPPADSRFEPVPLEHDLNASLIGREAVAPDSLPEAGKAIPIQVPFVFPKADERGNDHIDLGCSWMRFGALEGFFDSGDQSGPTTLCRWYGALGGDPGRVALRVPNRPYTHLYLIAASNGAPDTVPIVTAQFYRPQAGHPASFQARVPLFTASSTQETAIPVRFKSGGEGHLYVVDIPLEPEGLDSFSDLPCLEVELTKQVELFRAYPDPANFSKHGAGLPSGVQVYAATFVQPGVRVDFQPDKYAHIWTAPETPWYTIALTNDSDQPREENLVFSTVSCDEQEQTSVEEKVVVPAHSGQTVKLPVHVKKYGYHKVQLQVRDADGTRTRTRGLAWLHPETRERGNWEEGRGPIFGFWDWDGGHVTPSGIPRLDVVTAAGVESDLNSFCNENFSESERQYAETHQMVTFYLATQIFLTKEFLGMPYDPSKRAEMEKAVIEAVRKSPLSKPSRINRPDLAIFFAEPVIGPGTYMSYPEYYGDPPYRMTEDEQKNFKNYRDQFIIGARAIKSVWPKAKCLMPWGGALFEVPFLRESKEATALVNGPALDFGYFGRLPEMQMDQVTYAETMWQWKQEWLKAGKTPEPNIAIEGPCVTPATPGGLSPQEEADNTVRALLMLMPYGTTRFLGWPSAFRCAGAWGETHYGGGLCERLPLLTPKPVYAAYATLTRQVNRMNYVKAVETGSATVFCFQFKHYKTGELLHVLWTVRGKRPVTLNASPDGTVAVYDQMDNAVALRQEKEGQVSFTIDSSPCYVRGLKEDAKLSLGEPDHRDSQPSPDSVRLASLGDGSWTVSPERDHDYEDEHPEFIKPFPGAMSVRSVEAPPEQGQKALAVHLEKQEKERFVMPYYTTLVPPKPVVIPGKASHLGLWVRAASDWGRVIYCLQDAKGERWTSIGKKDEWNNDDMYCRSRFCFDGWRYLQFELPANAPYDCYREAGTTWWTYHGGGEGIVALPLTLEKIIVERRTHVIKGDELKPANPEDVLLADLRAEYEGPADKTEEAVRLSRLRMPLPSGEPSLENPIQKLKETGVGQPTTLTKVAPPEREYDGTRCLVYFETVAGAKSYNIWVSTYEDGRGAVCLGQNWTASGQLLTGLNPGTPLYLFVTYADKDGKPSKPSASLRILLKDQFPFK